MSLKGLQEEYAAGKIDLDQIGLTIRAWQAHTDHANCRRIREVVLDHHPFVRTGGIVPSV